MAYSAVHRYARISARKVRPLADLIRGKHADEALDLLRYQPQRGARLREKVLKSALGNAEDRRAPLGLIAADAFEDPGPVVQPVAEHVDPRLVPGDELAVSPDQLRLLHSGKYAEIGARSQFARRRGRRRSIQRGDHRSGHLGGPDHSLVAFADRQVSRPQPPAAGRRRPRS